jgi:hypothetical protein
MFEYGKAYINPSLSPPKFRNKKKRLRRVHMPDEQSKRQPTVTAEAAKSKTCKEETSLLIRGTAKHPERGEIT